MGRHDFASALERAERALAARPGGADCAGASRRCADRTGPLRRRGAGRANARRSRGAAGRLSAHRASSLSARRSCGRDRTRAAGIGAGAGRSRRTRVADRRSGPFAGRKPARRRRRSNCCRRCGRALRKRMPGWRTRCIAAGDREAAAAQWREAQALLPLPEYGLALWKLARERNDEREAARFVAAASRSGQAGCGTRRPGQPRLHRVSRARWSSGTGVCAGARRTAAPSRHLQRGTTVMDSGEDGANRKKPHSSPSARGAWARGAMNWRSGWTMRPA